jgi:hypothetical protein
MTSGASGLWYEAAPFGCAVPVMSDAVPVTYSASVYVSPPVYAHSGLTVGPATHAAQLSLFGFPLIGGSIGTTMSW